MAAEDLVQVLQDIAPFGHDWVDGDVGSMEDASLLLPEGEDGPGLVFTVDFITPIVDDEAAFGAIAAANAISDVYAMGGTPQVALSICGFPSDRLSKERLTAILRGGRDKSAEAGCAIVGGHTVLDPELKYGLCVLGSVDPKRALRQTGAEVGQKLLLSKPIGTGIAAQGIKKEKLGAEAIERVVASMTRLNADGRDAALAAGSRAATDVTGFGLLGHLHNLLAGSGHAARLEAASVPKFEGIEALAREGIVPGGSRKNLAYVAEHVAFADGLAEWEQLVLADAQTSGGMLFAVDAGRVDEALAVLHERGALCAAVIGEIVAGRAGSIEVH